MASSLAATGKDSHFGASKPPPKVHQRKVVKQIVDLLRNENPRKAHKPDEIAKMLLAAEKEMKVNMNDQTLLEDMTANPKLRRNEDGTFQYRPTHENIANSIALEKLLAEHPHGIFVEELLDAYHGVDDDIEVRWCSCVFCCSSAVLSEHLRVAARVQSGERRGEQARAVPAHAGVLPAHAHRQGRARPLPRGQSAHFRFDALFAFSFVFD